MTYTEPRKRWSDERRIAASGRASERMRERREAEAAKVSFARLTEMEKRIIARLAEKDDMTGEQITTASWPRLEEISAWEAMRDLEKRGLIFHDAVSRWAWRLTGCGRILMDGRGQGVGK